MKLKKLGLSGLLMLSCISPVQTALADGPDALGVLRLAAGILNEGIFPVSDAYTTNDDIIIQATDGVELAANVFVPTNLQENALAPLVIFINSWALNEYEYLTQAGQLAEKGYVVLSYSTRGFGQSGGMIGTAGPQDIQDLSTVIDYAIANFPVDPNAIGTAGISYGSGISLLGAAHDSRIKAISAMSSWGSLVEALYGNNTPRLVWGELLTITGDLLGNLDPLVNQHWSDLKSQNLAAIPAIKEWGMERSPITYVDQINQNGTAVYLGKAYGDILFQPNSLLELYGQLTVPKFIDLVPGTHATPDLLPSLLGVGEDTFWINTYDWFDHHLKGEDTAIVNKKPVQMKVKLAGRTEGYDSFPVPEASDEIFYLHPESAFDDGDLETYQYTGWKTDDGYDTLIGSILETGIPLLSELLEQFDIPIRASVVASSVINSQYYMSSTLQSPMKIRGNPKLKLRIQPHATKAQIFAYLYDVDAIGMGTLITHGAYTLPEVAYRDKTWLDFELVTTAYDIPAGHKLAIAFDSKDIEYKSVTSAGYTMDIEFNPESTKQNVLTLPTIQ